MKVKILAGIGIGCAIAAIFMAIHNGKQESSYEFENETTCENEEEETIAETVIRKIKTYWPTIVLTASAIFFLTFSLHMSAKSTIAAIAAYKLSVDSCDKYKAATKEIAGNKKESYISAKASEYKMLETKLNKTLIKKVDDRETLIYDPVCKAYFYKELKEIKELTKRLNDSMVCNGGFVYWVPYKKFKDGLGLSNVKVEFDENSLGWNNIDGNISIFFDVQTLDDGEVCIVLTYRIAPHYSYHT